MDSFGHVLSEGTMFLFVLLVGIGVVAVRRRLNDKPAFSDQDWRFFFGKGGMGALTPRFCLKLGLAVVLFSVFALVEVLLLDYFGAGILAGVLVLTLIGVIKLTLA
ncbi:MAG TPA: hypothetical protein VFU31_29935 [Candidatus Binatia bacterium]|nr:hypothetical protein [Candidatus Binatia bacterium]